MKRHVTIARIRNVATAAVIFIMILFFGFSSYLWIAYRNVLRDDVTIDADKRLLTDFDTSKFDKAVDRLEKRRNLEGPAEGIRDPFGSVSK